MLTFPVVSPSISVFQNFEDATQKSLEFLQNYIGLQLWMLTRVEGENWLVLSAQDRGYGVQAGEVFCWSDSFCSRMMQGLGPQVAPCSSEVLAYAKAPIAQQVAIQAYVGVPLYLPDGSFFGTLCAIDPNPQRPELQEYLPLVQCIASLLASLLFQELQTQEHQRQQSRLELESQQDALTQIYNRRGWEQFLALEEEGCRRFGTAASVVIIDLDNFKNINDSLGHLAGDQVLQHTAKILQSSVRECDVVARFGGDEFAILLVNCTFPETEQIVARICENLTNANIQASIGWSVRKPNHTLADTLHRADCNMYTQKAYRRQAEQSSSCHLSASLSLQSTLIEQ